MLTFKAKGLKAWDTMVPLKDDGPIHASLQRLPKEGFAWRIFLCQEALYG
ncbi:hypothetical protein KEJ19_03800 [Candidatus Bathyarchaeota archaeon]|nr:hypothetical protein [Candidatus Bathyarchaeota archaeon]